MARSAQRGFTLIEVLVTLSVLAVGIVSVYRSYLLTFDELFHVNCRLAAINLLNERAVAIERDLKEKGAIPFNANADVKSAAIQNKSIDFHYETAISNVEDLQNFYAVTLNLWWQERTRTIRLTRSFYVTN